MTVINRFTRVNDIQHLGSEQRQALIEHGSLSINGRVYKINSLNSQIERANPKLSLLARTIESFSKWRAGEGARSSTVTQLTRLLKSDIEQFNQTRHAAFLQPKLPSLSETASTSGNRPQAAAQTVVDNTQAIPVSKPSSVKHAQPIQTAQNSNEAEYQQLVSLLGVSDTNTTSRPETFGDLLDLFKNSSAMKLYHQGLKASDHAVKTPILGLLKLCGESDSIKLLENSWDAAHLSTGDAKSLKQARKIYKELCNTVKDIKFSSAHIDTFIRNLTEVEQLQLARIASEHSATRVDFYNQAEDFYSKLGFDEGGACFALVNLWIASEKNGYPTELNALIHRFGEGNQGIPGKRHKVIALAYDYYGMGLDKQNSQTSPERYQIMSNYMKKQGFSIDFMDAIDNLKVNTCEKNAPQVPVDAGLYGLRLFGKEGGHGVALKVDPENRKFEYFDPNHGVFSFDSHERLESFLNNAQSIFFENYDRYITDHYLPIAN